MHRSFPTLLLSVILLITANTCNGLSDRRHVAYEDASAIAALPGASSGGGPQTNAQCCGDTCCANDEICELGGCISKDIVNSGRLIRFTLDWKKNGLLLRNMCNGMQGKNTAVLTYSGDISASARAAKQRAAGCDVGYCRALINNGTNTSDLDSCNDFPPASSNEGGATRPANARSISCIPGYQNCIQGAVFRSVYRGTGIQAGQQFAISIDCAQVLNYTVKRGLADDSFDESKRSILKKRDVINMTGTTNANDTFNLENNATPYVSAPFGDLSPGTYSAQVTTLSGSVANSVVIANEGNSYTNESLQAIAINQTQQFLFTLQDSDIGVGMIFEILNNTVIEWTLQGSSTGVSNATSTGTAAASSTAKSSDALDIPPSFKHWWNVFIGIIMLQLLL